MSALWTIHRPVAVVSCLKLPGISAAEAVLNMPKRGEEVETKKKKKEARTEDEKMVIPNEVQLQATPDPNTPLLPQVDLQPLLGTSGTLIHLTFPSCVTLDSQNYPILIKIGDEETRIDSIRVRETQTLALNFPALSEVMPQSAPLVCQIQVGEIQHGEIIFHWVKPAILRAAKYLLTTGLRFDLDYMINKDTFHKVRSLNPRERGILLHHYAVLGKSNSLTSLAETYGINLALACPETRQNILHVAIQENWPEVLKIAIKFPHLFFEADLSGRTPQNLLDALGPEDPRRAIVNLSLLWGPGFYLKALPHTQLASGPVGFDTSLFETKGVARSLKRKAGESVESAVTATSILVANSIPNSLEAPLKKQARSESTPEREPQEHGPILLEKEVSGDDEDGVPSSDEEDMSLMSDPEAKPRKTGREMALKGRKIRPSVPPDFRKKLTHHFATHRLNLDPGHYQHLKKTWLLEHFKKSIHSRQNSDSIIYIRHKETGVLVVACLSLLMKRVKRPQSYLAHLLTKGFKRVKFAKKTPDSEVPALDPFFRFIPDFVVTRPEHESFSGALKVYYRVSAPTGGPDVPESPIDA